MLLAQRRVGDQQRRQMGAGRMTDHDQAGEQTRAVHGPPLRPVVERPLSPPVHRVAAFAFDSSVEYRDKLAGTVAGWSYSRVDNPTAAYFADCVAALEGVGLDSEVVVTPRPSPTRR